ncbi:tRNA pseudouridine synthase A [Geomicrobium sp. JCM 19037]|uniref:tRNA pseudouridine(38-40) synthase TruA n=1 Tax=Geomicrobium sp. JCM 19037 TaxID=1460634 RepID=UPI00045F4873|nr:tRNA pseudouridine(38-40) synthase TruA [Geomicrobium sp. JCM 19037]GAK04762.1 tRNA pseudouridine synthase A [Geomicrobium sp. JCM 19037]
MPRLKAVLAYDGTHFSGWQVQPEKRTVQGEIGRALGTLHRMAHAENVTASGRTDSGVHAVGQVVHFDSQLAIPEERWPKAIMSLLPDDILIQRVEVVRDDFHARYDAVEKEYRYYVQIGKNRDVFQRNYTHHVYTDHLDSEAMNKALEKLVGKYDFSSFCASNTSVVDKVRTLKLAQVQPFAEHTLMFRFRGEGFLYNMVRIIVGTVLEVGQGRRTVEEITTIRDGKDRRLAGKTAPAQGLYLWEVAYRGE